MDTQQRQAQTATANARQEQTWKAHATALATYNLLKATEDDPNYPTNWRAALLDQTQPERKEPTVLHLNEGDFTVPAQYEPYSYKAGYDQGEQDTMDMVDPTPADTAHAALQQIADTLAGTRATDPTDELYTAILHAYNNATQALRADQPQEGAE